MSRDGDVLRQGRSSVDKLKVPPATTRGRGNNDELRERVGGSAQRRASRQDVLRQARRRVEAASEGSGLERQAGVGKVGAREEEEGVEGQTGGLRLTALNSRSFPATVTASPSR